MLTGIHPKLPMRNKAITRSYYLDKLHFQEYGSDDFDGYLMLERDNIQIHFFGFSELNPTENYGQVYIRTDDIEALYHSLLNDKVSIHPAGKLGVKPWGQKEFSLLDPDNNLLTFGQAIVKQGGKGAETRTAKAAIIRAHASVIFPDGLNELLLKAFPNDQLNDL